MKTKSIWCDGVKKTLMIPENTRVVFPYVWTYDKQNQITEPKDIEFITPCKCPLILAILMLEQIALSYVKSTGADDIRQYFIEGTRIVNSDLHIIWGT